MDFSKKTLLIAIPLVFFSCTGKFPSKETSKDFCFSYLGKTVKVQATYKGWECPKNCGPPPLTTSDVCWLINNICLYSLPVAKLDPLKDVGKKFFIEAKVLKNKKGNCYLKVLSISPLMNTGR